MLFERRPLFHEVAASPMSSGRFSLLSAGRTAGWTRTRDLEHITHVRVDSGGGRARLGEPLKAATAAPVGIRSSWNVSTRRTRPGVRNCSRAPLAGARQGSGFEARRRSGKSADSFRDWIRQFGDEKVQT